MLQEHPPRSTPSHDPGRELYIIHGEFSSYLSQAGYPLPTRRLYQNSVERAARWLTRRSRSILDITGADVPAILREYFWRIGHCRTKIRHRAALHAWLRFRGLPRVFPDSARSGAWWPWIQEYDRFLASDHGLALNTRIYHGRYAKLFMRARFGDGPAHWDQVVPQDIWRFAERFAQRVKPCSANVMLASLRAFFRYVQLRGACSEALQKAVPQVADYGNAVPLRTLSEQQLHRLIASLPSRRPADIRDRAMILCMAEAGLRASEVAQLRVADFDGQNAVLNVFSPKTGEWRQLPLSKNTVDAITRCLREARPAAANDRLFWRMHPPNDQAPSAAVVRCAVRRAYDRCGFPQSWTGTHRLRHSFATRLYARGADLVQIANLLGHRCIDSSRRYAHTDLKSLRPLAQPWPSP